MLVASATLLCAGAPRPWALAGFAVASTASAVDLALPSRSGSVKFSVLGDFGSGESSEYEVAGRMAAFRTRFPFDFVITTGDNIIGSQDKPADFVEKFERPFQALLGAGVPFYATLGNHDKASNRSYAPWNMNGRRYYTFAVKNVRFFALDSNRPDRAELAWVDEALRSSNEEWKICYFHHPLYSDGVKHGPALELRVLLEPILARHGVDVVFSGLLEGLSNLGFVLLLDPDQHQRRIASLERALRGLHDRAIQAITVCERARRRKCEESERYGHRDDP